MNRRHFVLASLASSLYAAVPSMSWARNWADMGKQDVKPLRPDFDNMYSVGGSAMVSSDHPFATEAALWALERGGTAVDAYITAALTQCVLEPTMTTIAGGFGLAYWDASEAQQYYAGGGFGYPSGVPASEAYDDQKAWTGWSVMVPGYMRGVEIAHRNFGKLPWNDLFTPAVTFAREGFVIDHLLWGYTKGARKMVGRYPGTGRKTWFRDGYLLGVGDTLYQPELAKVMEHLRDEGADYFYDSPFSRELVETVQRHGGGITDKDMKNFKQAFSIPLWKPGGPGAVPYRGYEVAPASGVLFQLAMRVYEALDLRGMGPPTASLDALHCQVRLQQELWHRGGEVTEETQAELLSDETVKAVTDAIRNGPVRPFRGFAAATCALTIADKYGNVAIGTHSSSSEPYGAGLNVQGVVLNRATYMRKYKNMPQGFSTQLWLFRDGKPAIVAATPSRSFMECLLQASANIVEYDMSLEQTVMQPRFGHPHPGTDAFEIEGDFDQALLDGLVAKGHKLFPVSPNDVNMGSIHALHFKDDGIHGVADPRRRGLAKGV